MSTDDPVSARQLLAWLAANQPRMPGGCEQCDAYQELVEVEPGVFLNQIFHDDWCPEQQARQARRNDSDDQEQQR